MVVFVAGVRALTRAGVTGLRTGKFAANVVADG